MKIAPPSSVRPISILASLIVLFLAALNMHAGITFDLRLIRDSQGASYNFYTPLETNATLPAAPLGIYVINSPQQPTNGTWRQYELTTNGFVFLGGGSGGYGDFASVMQQITNGFWTLLFTNATTTNTFRFTVSAPTLSSNMLPPLVISTPVDGSTVTSSSQPTFDWVWSNSWGVNADAFVFNGDFSYFVYNSIPAGQTNWSIPTPIPNGTPRFFQLHYTTNFTTPLIVASTPTNVVSGAPISGWTSISALEAIHTAIFTMNAQGAPPTLGHSLLAYYSFEDNNLQAYDFSGHGNNLNYAWFGTPPVMVTNDAADGTYAGGLGGSGWFVPPTNLVASMAGSFSVSLWLKTTNVHGSDNDSQYSAAGICSALSGDYNNSVMPMGQTGSKLAFYTGGTPDHLLRSQANINTGQYVHAVVTRDQRTGEKKIYVNGVLDASAFSNTNMLTGSASDGLAFGYNNGQVFNGKLDEIQLYSGVLSASEVQQLYNNPGTTIPDVSGNNANGIIAHYDFDGGTALAADVSGNGNNLTISGDFGGNGPATNSAHIAVSGGSLSLDGGSYISAPTNLLATLARSFSISLWIKTTQDNGNPNDLAWTGDAIISADSPNPGANDLIPVALTGGQVAFNTANTGGSYDDTINSSAYVSDGLWHHIVVSRNQPTGEKFIYVDGVLDVSNTDATNILNTPKILTIGCKADASNPNQTSPSSTGSNGYDGLIDDIQIYDRALNSNEVAYLQSNPGATLAAVTNALYPVSVDLQFNISRVRDNGSEYYLGGVSFNSVSPEATTTNLVRSPNDYYNTETHNGGGSGGSVLTSTLGEVINEFTNGLWKIFINMGTPTQQVYSFRATISGLDTNLLKPTIVFSPTNGAVNVVTNPAFRWSGPSNFSTLVADLLSGPAIFPPVGTTNWSPAPILSYGSERFDVSYTSNNFGGATFTTPVSDLNATPVAAWNTSLDVSSTTFTYFIVGAPAPLPVQLVNVQPTNGTLRFSFQSLGGRPHIVQARTNLTAGAWVDLTNFIGDGTLKQLSFPATNPPIRFFRVSTQ